MSHSELQPLLRKLTAITAIPAGIGEALLDLKPILKDFGPDEPIVREGDRPTHVAVVVTGFVYRYKMVDPDKRQIMAFHLAGDMPDLQGLHLDVMDHGVAPSVATRMALIPHRAVFDLIDRYPPLAHILWREALIDGAIFREWVVNVGRREGFNRVAHLFCEIFSKAKAVGLSDAMECALPLSQIQIGDATGLSSVHVNRMLQSLRKEGLIKFERRTLTVLDWIGLKEVGDFDATYLHLKKGEDEHPNRPNASRH